jgi:hypothetical protein
MVAKSIPASQLVAGTPSVLGPGGNLLALVGVAFTQDASIPIGVAPGFPTVAAVQAWFGVSSAEAAFATIYFQGFDGANMLPGLLYFMQYNTTAVAGYVRSGSFAGVALTALQALSGTLTTITDGVSSTSAAINLASASSFSNAAALIQTGIQAGTPSTTATCTYDAQRAAFVIKSPTTGSASTEAFATGSISAGLKLTSATGAVVSAGAAIQTPAGGVAALVAATQNWVTMTTLWEPVVADKVLFAQAISALGQKKAYVGWDTDVTPTTTVPATASFGVLVDSLNGIIPVWGPVDKAAFIMGTTASIDFTETNGRITYAYRGLAGLVPDVTDVTIAANLLANGYNFYGDYANESQQFMFLQNGQISGTWLWIDPYINQIKLNSDLQVAFLNLLRAMKAIPYNIRGRTAINSAALDPINAALNFGSIVGGVTLSQAQRQEVNSAAGLNIADILQTRGWYLQVKDADPSVRTTRGSPPVTLWYTDGGSIQKINFASIDLE